MPMKIFVRVAVFVGVVAVLVLPALAQQPVPQINLSNLRVVNALVGLGPVDVYLDGERVAYSLAPEAATPYFSIPYGKHSLLVRLPDSDPLSAPIADVLVDLAPNQSETAIAYQKQFATGDFAPSYEQAGAFFVLDDDRSSIEMGKTRLTAVHLAFGSPEVVSLTYPSRESLLHQITLEKPYGSVDIDARIYSMVVVNADSPDLSVLTRLGDYSFYTSTLYTVITVPDLQPTLNSNRQPQVKEAVASLRAFVVSAPIDPPPDGVYMRLIHAAPNTAVLDLYVDGRLAVERMNYSRVTEYLGLKGYSHNITLRRVGDGPTDPPLAQAQFTISEENRQQTHWTLMLLNAAGGDTGAALSLTAPGETEPQTTIRTPGGSLFLVLLPDNIAQTQHGYARVRLINVVNDIPPLRLLADVIPPPPLPPGVLPTVAPRSNVPTATPPPPQQLVDDVVFAAEANEAEVPAGLYPSLRFIPGGTTNTLETLENVQLVDGMVYTFVAMGSPFGNPPISVISFSDYGSGIPINRLYLGRITAVNANIRSNTSLESRILGQLTRNTQVEVLGRNPTGEWIRVRFTDPTTNARREGWISATANIIAVTRLGVPVSVLALPRYIAPSE